MGALDVRLQQRQRQLAASQLVVTTRVAVVHTKLENLVFFRGEKKNNGQHMIDYLSALKQSKRQKLQCGHVQVALAVLDILLCITSTERS